MAPPLVQLSDITLTFGGTPLLEGVELAVSSGDRVCLVGRNGSGKSTLLKIAAGLMVPDRGTRFVQPGSTVRYLAQEPDFGGHATTLGFIEAGLGPGDDRYPARYLVEQLELDAEQDPARLSGGEARRAALARALAPDPDILLLDEPTNHLDLPTIEWLEQEIDRRRAAMVMVSHDRRFLQRLSRATVWLDRGRARRIEIGFSAFESWRDETLAEEERDRHKLDRKIEAEADWVRYGVTARRKRNVRRMAELQQLRQQRRDHRRAAGRAAILVAEGEKSGTVVIEADRIGKSFGDRIIVSDSGALPPDTGTIRLGVNLAMASLDQRRDSLDPRWTLSEALTGGSGDTVMVAGKPRHVIGYLKDFLFAPEQAKTPLEVLSGGERGRLMLARALARPSNLLVLDEPTNDLDLETLDVLEETLGEYPGTVILISHDRDFLDRVVTTVIVPEGNGRWLEYAGGYTDMLAQRGADIAGRPVSRATPKADAPPPRAAIASPPQRRRLSFHQKHALETLPDTIAALGDKVRDLQNRLADPHLYGRDRKAFEETSVALTAAQSALASAEEKWLELELLREEIEGE
ncbi:MAG: ABC-F family ATP-binding cassette domain-containing protein [Xanthobacteraceae bacterium]